jgi:methionyl-tRNA formyltransferase
MKIVFMGTPDFAACSLEALKEYYDIALVVTQPDRPSGRGYKLTPPPVKKVAQKYGLNVIQPERVGTSDIIDKLREINPDAIVVVAFGQKIPQEILNIPALGCINLHGSLLPKYRGAAPIQRAIMNGDSVTGLTTMLMDEGWDTGDMFLKCEVPIELEDTAGTLHDKMKEEGAKLLVKTLEKLQNKEIEPIQQDHKQATYAQKITKKDQIVTWDRSAKEVYNHIRALLPWPGVKFIHNGKGVSLASVSLGMSKISSQENIIPGTVVEVTDDWFEIACKEETIRVGTIKPDGSRFLTIKEYINGYNLSKGQQLEPISEK